VCVVGWVCVRDRHSVRQATQRESAAMKREGMPKAMAVMTSGDINQSLGWVILN